MAQFARLPVGIRRLLYRVAYALLCVYWFIRRPDAHGVKCVLTDGDLVLLVRHTYGPSDWEIPGGAIKSGEPPVQAARRETQEELGVTIRDWTALEQVTGRLLGRRDTLHCFHAEVRDPTLTLDLGELSCARWFARDKLPSDIGYYTGHILAQLPVRGRSAP